MEVHHHRLTPRKNWNHYFWEFLMLFLAVSAGFLAENMREDRIEHRREKKLMHSLLQDLNADIIQIDSLKIRRTARNMNCDSLITLLTTSPSGNIENKSLIYFYGRNASRRIHFRPQAGTLQQLRSSGGFRVVHDTAVLNGINDYELLLKANLENIDVEEKELTGYANVAAKVFDVRVFQQMIKNNTIEPPPGNPVLLSYDTSVLNELCIKLHYWKRTSLSILYSFDELKAAATRLTMLIEKEYHLE